MLALRRCNSLRLGYKTTPSSLSKLVTIAPRNRGLARWALQSPSPKMGSGAGRMGIRYVSASSTTHPTPSQPIRTIERNGININIDDSDHFQFIKRASQVWPPLGSTPSTPSPPLPSGWSSTWSAWPYLLTYYWFSPYFLMLPQIEMLLNIRYGIPGEARPLCFEIGGRNRWVMTVVGVWKGKDVGVGGGGGFYLVEGREEGVLWKFKGIQTESDLLKLLHSDPSLTTSQTNGTLLRMDINPEGEAALERILQRDVGVIPVLAEKFLDYVPEVTRVEEESVVGGNEDEVVKKLVDEMEGEFGVKLGGDEELIRMMEGLVDEIRVGLEKERKEEI